MPSRNAFAIVLVLLVGGGPAIAAEEAAGGTHAEEHAAADDHGGGEGHAEGSAGGGVNPIAVDVDLALFTLIVFVLLLTLLRFVAWDPIVKALEAREEGISGEIAAAAAKHEEAKALLAEHAAKVAAATDDVKAMLEEARRDAEVTKSQIIDDARSAAEAEKQRAIRDVEQARDSAMKLLAEESANLAVDLAGKVVKQEISPTRHGEIVREAIGRLTGSEPSNN